MKYRKNLKILEDLKSALGPYSFFWDEWIVNGDCNLSNNEITLINIYIKNNFEINIFDLVEYYKNSDSIKQVIRKLELGYQIFKDVVVVDFLLSVYKMARKYGYDEFMQTPIRLLKIEEELKETLLNFEKITVQQIFFTYKPEHFAQAWIYKHIVNFQIYQLKQQNLIHQ